MQMFERRRWRMLLTWFSGSGFNEKLTRSFLKLSERHQLTFSFAASSRQT